jgi:bifunctional UDP-N-acetylglucosamine pyrophosphorylase/glucosamine-1-phosphate N-acetyltransferase
MQLVAVIIANDPCPPHSLIPPCLETILGDAVLLWQLRALHAEIDRVCIITNHNHEIIANLTAESESKFEVDSDVGFYHSPDILQALFEMSKTEVLGMKAQVILMRSTQPLITTHAIQELATKTGILVPLNQLDTPSPIVGPMSLSWATLQAEVRKMIVEAKELNCDEFFERISTAIHFERVECDPECLLQIKNRRDLTDIQAILRKRIIERWIDSGVAIMDPQSVIIGPRVELAQRGIVIESQVRIEGSVTIGEGTKIAQGVVIQDSSFGSNVEILPYCVINDSVIGDSARVGPFAHLRNGSKLDSNVHLGNFVETKMARLHSGAKANHLSYLGDCEIGERSNIGAGCITCNYDGFIKHHTVVGKDVFIGSDCQLVAPVTIGDGALLGAGTTLTTNVPKDALVLTRPETTVKEGGAERLRTRLRT